MDSRLEKYSQILAAGHEIARSNVPDDDLLTSAQCLATGGSRAHTYPLPTLDGLCTEPPVPEELQFTGRPSLRMNHLDTGKVSMQNRECCIEDLFVQRLRSLGAHQLCGDVLKTVCGVNLLRKRSLALSQCRVGSFQLAGLPPKKPFQFRVHGFPRATKKQFLESLLYISIRQTVRSRVRVARARIGRS